MKLVRSECGKYTANTRCITHIERREKAFDIRTHVAGQENSLIVTKYSSLENCENAMKGLIDFLASDKIGGIHTMQGDEGVRRNAIRSF